MSKNLTIDNTTSLEEINKKASTTAGFSSENSSMNIDPRSESMLKTPLLIEAYNLSKTYLEYIKEMHRKASGLP
ncbi:hypothetical protein TNIN_196751, partial [Trichonephila inaurata madagascariensis]